MEESLITNNSNSAGVDSMSKKAELVEPDYNRHKYVIGIDFGHGETSAAYCELEWDKAAGLKDDRIVDLDLDRQARKKVITSAICRVDSGIKIGDEAFEHLTDHNGLRIGFKQKPTVLNGVDEKLMTDYMQAVYSRIRQYVAELTDDNHLVYIARPSGWTDPETKNLYCSMALSAGIPLAGLTSESRAAIFYAKSPKVNFSNAISKGAIVFDLGSSTLDFTYLAEDEKPVDFGYNLGASIIDNAIFEQMILNNKVVGEKITEFLSKHSGYTDALKFKARKFKEDAYSKSADSKFTTGFQLDCIINEDEESYDDYADIYVPLRIKSLAELNDLIEDNASYITKLKEAIADFRDNKIPGKKINGVFLTGGASRMNFIIPTLSEALGLPESQIKIDGDNPSLTISRGIAMLGSVDVTTKHLVTRLRNDISSKFTEDKVVKVLGYRLSKAVSKSAWATVKRTCSNWIENGKTTKRDELKTDLEFAMRSFRTNELPQTLDYTLKEYLVEESEEIRKNLNKVISQYAPGREINLSGSIESVEAQTAIIVCINALTTELKDSANMGLSEIVGEILWKALAVFLWGVFAIPYYILKNIVTSDKHKRKEKAKSVLNQKATITSNIETNIQEAIYSNFSIRKAIFNNVLDYFNTLIDKNLQKVIIPIE